jgi:HD-GYP domain-containing protein (c-di-GMP phosphodiesterase class II)
MAYYLLAGSLFLIAVFIVIILIVTFKVYPKRIRETQLEVLSMLMGVKDLYSASHSEHVEGLCELFWDYIPKDLRKDMSKKALLKAARTHDIGKLFINEIILNKPGRLTDEEFAEIKTHASIGAKILDRTLHSEISNMVYCHHEKLDGTGYHGAKDTQIPIESKILSICDTFSALTTHRVYQPAKSMPEAFKVLREVAGTQLDSQLVECFISIGIPKLRTVDTMINNQYFVGGKKKRRWF